MLHLDESTHLYEQILDLARKQLIKFNKCLNETIESERSP